MDDDDEDDDDEDDDDDDGDADTQYALCLFLSVAQILDFQYRHNWLAPIWNPPKCQICCFQNGELRWDPQIITKMIALRIEFPEKCKISFPKAAKYYVIIRKC